MSISSQNLPRSFQGIWIPKEIWFDKRLNYFEKCLLSEIHSLDDEKKGCFASNKYFCEFFNESERKIQDGLSKLKKLGYIIYEKFDGRIRTLRSNLYPDKTLFSTPEVQKPASETVSKHYLAPGGCEKPHPSPIGDSIEPENIDYNIDKKKNPPNPPSGGAASGDAVCDGFGKFVKLKKEELKDLFDKYGHVAVKELIDDINDYLSSSGKKPYKDYAATIRQWAKRKGLKPIERDDPIVHAEKKEVPKRAMTEAESDQEWLEKMRDVQVMNLQRQMRMIYGQGFVEFPEISGAKFYFGEPSFRNKVENTLRKLDIYLSNKS